MVSTESVRARLRRLLGRRSIVSGAADIVERVGFHTLADRIDRIRSEGDLVPIRVPAPGRALRTRRLKMYEADGADQVVRAMRAGGWRAFEAPLPDVVTLIVRRWPETVLDVGANTGLYALIAVTAHPSTEAVAFEPVPEIAARLRSNIAANLQRDRVLVKEVAIGASNGTAELHFPPAQLDGTLETSASLDREFNPSVAHTITVQTSTLDDAWRDQGSPPTSLVKIDVEGAEAEVLSGATQLIAANRPIFAVEILPRCDTDAIAALLAEHDYVDVTLSPVEAVVNSPEVTYVPIAPNHLLVPSERLADLVADLRSLHRFKVTVLD